MIGVNDACWKLLWLRADRDRHHGGRPDDALCKPWRRLCCHCIAQSTMTIFIINIFDLVNHLVAHIMVLVGWMDGGVKESLIRFFGSIGCIKFCSWWLLSPSMSSWPLLWCKGVLYHHHITLPSWGSAQPDSQSAPKDIINTDPTHHYCHDHRHTNHHRNG